MKHNTLIKLEDDTYKLILESLHDGLYIVDKNRVIRYWNKAAEKISGFTAEEVVGSACADNILNHIDADGNSICKEVCPLAATIADGELREAKVYLHHKDGHRLPVSVRVAPITDAEGNIIGGIELFSDISIQIANESRIKELEKLAFFDELTSLGNRSYIEKAIHIRFEESKRFKIPFGILFIDIDHFKVVNDKYGHDIGDKILKFVAHTFTINSRPFDVYGRWGGEEFVGVIPNINKFELELLGNRLRKLIENSYIMHKSQKLSVTISIGATLFRENDTIESIIKRADTLLYQSKKKGRNCTTIG